MALQAKPVRLIWDREHRGIASGLDVRPVALDVTDPHAARVIAAQLSESTDVLDALENAAAIHYDTWRSAVDADLTTVREAIETSLLPSC